MVNATESVNRAVHRQPDALGRQGPLVCDYCEIATLEPCNVPDIGSFFRCRTCGLLQMGTTVARDILPFPDNSSAALREEQMAVDIRLSRLASLLPSGAPRLLDIGIDRSTTVERARELGWQATAVLDEPRRVSESHRRGLDVRHAPPTRIPFPTEHFDVVTAWYTLERVADARAALAEWQRVLRPGGILAIEVHHTASWHVGRVGASLDARPLAGMRYGFTPHVLRGLLRDESFEVLPGPGLGRLELLSFRSAFSSVWRQTRQALQTLALRSGSFQVYCRRPFRSRGVVRMRAAA